MSGQNHGGGGGHGGGGQERWLLTYADMITLLMVLFIVMYAMSELDKAKYASVATSLHAAMGGGNQVINMSGVGDGVSVPMPTNPITGPNGQGTGKGDLLEGIGQGLYADFVHDGRFTVRVSERGLIISLAGSAAFDSGQDEIRSEFFPLLDAIASRVKDIPNDISVEGFTDSDPITTADFPSNWYLAAARANKVRDYLEDRGVTDERMIVVGYGDTRPVFDNQTEEGKAKNRRVDVVILRNKQVIDLGQEINTGKK